MGETRATVAGSHPRGHLPISEVTGVWRNKLKFLLSKRITHARWVGEGTDRWLEVSRFDKGGDTYPHWEVFQVRGRSWRSIPT